MEDGSAKRERDDGADAAAAAVDDAPAAKEARAADAAGEAAAPAADAQADAPAPKERPHGKKRKVVVLFGYVGAGYQGMQRNPGARTIEDELERALHAAGGISDENMGDFSKARARSGSRGRHAPLTRAAARLRTRRSSGRAPHARTRASAPSGRPWRARRVPRAVCVPLRRAPGAHATLSRRHVTRRSFASTLRASRTASTPRCLPPCVLLLGFHGRVI